VVKEHADGPRRFLHGVAADGDRGRGGRCPSVDYDPVIVTGDGVAVDENVFAVRRLGHHSLDSLLAASENAIGHADRRVVAVAQETKRAACAASPSDVPDELLWKMSPVARPSLTSFPVIMPLEFRKRCRRRCSGRPRTRRRAGFDEGVRAHNHRDAAHRLEHVEVEIVTSSAPLT